MPAGKSIRIEVAPATAVVTPYAMAKMSEDFHLASRQYVPSRIPFVNYYLYCASIELALKSAILNTNCTEQRKAKLKKDIGHNLEKLVHSYEAIVQTELLTKADKQTLQAINKYYSTKGLEYFTTVMAKAMLHGYKDLPAIDDIQQISEKLQTYLRHNDYFINATTSAVPTTGILTVY